MSPPEDPYADQTEHNTNTDWLSDQEPLDVELDGMTDYAGNMKTLSENLQDLQTQLNLLGTVPTQAWDTVVLPEMAYMRHRFLGNYAELTQYLGNLQQALMNIGMAAQTIADAYRGTDGWSGASVDAVRFAFGDRRVSPPPGLPGGVDYQTYFDARLAQSQQQQQGEGDRPGAIWTPPEKTEENGVTTYTSTNQFGETRTMTQQYVAGQGYVTTTTVTDRGGNVISQTRQSSYSANPSAYVRTSGTRTTTTIGDTQTTSSTSTLRVTNPEGGYTETTRNFDGDGNQTGATIVEVDEQGNQVVTTTRPNDEGEDEVVRQVRIGADTPGGGNVSHSPAGDAIRALGG